MPWLSERWDELRSRLLFVPVMFVIAGLVFSQVTLAVDRQLADDALPRVLKTTISSADSILSTIAGGLISAITLLLSLVLVSVQLASSQFSPRTVRDWIADTTQQRTIGVVLGTTVFCLMVLRETQSFDEGVVFAPHISVLVSVALAVCSLVAVVWSVDHLSNSMRIDSVAQNLAFDTVAAVERRAALNMVGNPQAVPATETVPTGEDAFPRADPEGMPIQAGHAGWVQQVDVEALLGALPAKSNLRLTCAPGAFVLRGEPLGWVEPAPDDDVLKRLERHGFLIGESRLLEHDPGYGLLQMSDVALRALSPGVNDPNTAADVVVHMGLVVLAIWEHPAAPSQFEHEDKTVTSTSLLHAHYLDAAYAQVLRYAASDHDVLATLIRSLHTLRAEITRRSLPGPVTPVDEFLARILDVLQSGSLSSRDKSSLADLIHAATPNDQTS